MTEETAVEYRYADGRAFVGAPCSEGAARSLVALMIKCDPRPVRVMRRTVGPWEPLDDVLATLRGEQ